MFTPLEKVRELIRDAMHDASTELAGRILSASFNNPPRTPEVNFLKHLPYLIVGSLNAKDIPLTEGNLSTAIDYILGAVPDNA